MKTVKETMKKILVSAAKKEINCASQWSYYQPKAPKSVEELKLRK